MKFNIVARYPRAYGIVQSQHFVATATGQRAYVYDCSSGMQLAYFPKLSYSYKPLITPDEKTLIVTGAGPNIIFCSLETMQVKKKINLHSKTTQIDDRILSGDGKSLLFLETMDKDLLSRMTEIDNQTGEIVNYHLQEEKLLLDTITYEPSTGYYWLTGYDRDAIYHVASDKYLLCFDGKNVISKERFADYNIAYCGCAKYSIGKSCFYWIDEYQKIFRFVAQDGKVIDSIALHLPEDTRLIYDYYYCDKRNILLIATSEALCCLDVQTGQLSVIIEKAYGFLKVGPFGDDYYASRDGGYIISTKNKDIVTALKGEK